MKSRLRRVVGALTFILIMGVIAGYCPSIFLAIGLLFLFVSLGGFIIIVIGDALGLKFSERCGLR
jgi:peptidoglycan/LPS O-acetylase OafA/YrhL